MSDKAEVQRNFQATCMVLAFVCLVAGFGMLKPALGVIVAGLAFFALAVFRGKGRPS